MIKKLLRSVRQFKKESLQTPLYVCLEVIMEVIIPILMANLIDYGIDNGNMSHVWKIGIALLISALFSLIFGAIAGKKAAHATCGFAMNLRKDMYYCIQNFSFANMDKFSTASMVTRLTTDITNVQNAYQMIIRMAVRAPIMLVASLLVVFTINVELSLIFLICIPFLGIGLWIIMRKAHPIFERVFRTYDYLNNIVQENLRGIRVVKSYVREDLENKKFTDISKSIYQDFTTAEKTLAFNMPLMQFSMYACMLFISWFGARVIVGSGGIDLSTGELMSLLTYAMSILSSLMMLSMVFVMITMARASAERIVEVLDEVSDIRDREDPIMQVYDGEIIFDNVSFRYAEDAESNVLENINLHIKSGECIGILGGTGSSKTSLVQLIPRLYDVSAGKIMIGGVDIRDYHIDSLRNAVAMVLQKNVLFSGTINENLRWGNENATDQEIQHACELAQADGFVQEFEDGYDNYIEQGGSNVSGGQKQRLCIARALLKKPKILILDDSTSAVDTKTDALIQQALKKEIPDTTKIIIAQRISSIQDADRIMVMDNGHLVACGSHEELLKTCDIYQEVYESQVKGGNDDEQ